MPQNVNQETPISYTIWLWNMAFYIKEGMQARSIWKQEPDVNIWALDGWEWEVEKDPH